MKLYMFRTLTLSIVRRLFTVHSAVVYVVQVCRKLSSRTRVPSWSCSTAVYKPVWHISLLSVQWINSWWWTDELTETCRVSWQNKFVKLVHLIGFIKKKFVTMHGHMNVKKTHFSVNEYHAGVWCVQSAIHVSHIHGSRNKVLGIRMFYILFYETPLHPYSYLHALVFHHNWKLVCFDVTLLLMVCFQGKFLILYFRKVPISFLEWGEQIPFNNLPHAE